MKCVVLSVFILVCALNVKAQFNTIQNQSKQGYVIIDRKKPNIEVELKEDSVHQEPPLKIEIQNESYRLARKKPKRTKVQRTSLSYLYIPSIRLEGLSIISLYNELLKNNIKHPKIVLAQAILETGWFKSPVCRNKGNLFGLTNPRTGDYYEFDHWKESVIAYRDKVQYKYKGGNYLLWLRKIGYAEDPGYVSALVRILEQHFL